VTPAQLRQANVELGLTRRRRELFFWTIRMTLTVIVSIAMTIALVVSLIQGASIDVAQMSLGAGITAVNAASGQILGLLRRLVRLKAPP
jgi:hypothetical protein